MTPPYEHMYSNQHQSKDSEVRKENSRLSKCCFCDPLKTSCFVLGYISLILNFIISMFFVITLTYLAIYTHGFRYLRTNVTEDGEIVPDMNSSFKQIIIITVLDGSLNLAWFVMCIVLLVGLHKRQPGHIKLQVSIAALRILLSIVTTISSVYCAAEILLSVFFILLYYSYAKQLKQEQLSDDPKSLSEIVSEVILKYPQNIDNFTLPEKKEKY
ncbi:uncharacterized protein LOC111354494 [Spodoptera litura]|uniref:Uncharacterized protein LOC111354494 n=1 Tax=Spodoptera litura TaxID=69820 RepID=A0A9J7E434_SPOLT|nr:uncharacterized protein LOC111354494 [Spodoptera litura]